MPAKKVAKKKAVKKAAPKKAAPPKTKTKKTVPKKTATPRVTSKPIHMPDPEDDFLSDGPMKECEHCDGIGRCTAGEPYDKGHHQMFGAKLMLTSCPVCLEASGEHKNSKKLVGCSFCKGTGQIKA